MKKTGKKISVFLLLFVLAFSMLLPVPGSADFSRTEATKIYDGLSISTISAGAYSVLDVQTGTVLTEVNGTEHHNVGYLVQLMTLYVVFESVAEGKTTFDTYFNVSKNAQAASVGRARVFLDASKGEAVTVSEAVKSVAICNAVDSAYALADYIGGSEAAFVEIMNAKAAEIGMTDTLFTDSTGIDRENQYTSANDLVRFGNTFLAKYPEILEYTKLTYGEFQHDTTGQGYTVMISSNNLTRGKFYPESDGFMVGFNKEEGYCQLATVEEDGKRVIVSVLCEPDEDHRAADCKKLMQYGLTGFEYRTVSQKGTFVRKIAVVDGESKRVDLYTAEDFSIILNKKDFDKLTSEICMNGDVVAPVSENDVVGAIIYKLDDEEVGRVDIVCGQDVEKANWFIILIRKILSWLGLD